MSIVRGGDWDRLATMDMYPFPLAIQIRYLTDGWEVELVVVVELTNGGSSSVVMGRFTQPYNKRPDGEPDMSPEAAEAVASEAIAHFATRLKDALRPDEPSG
jgi:hypothetical protein